MTFSCFSMFLWLATTLCSAPVRAGQAIEMKTLSLDVETAIPGTFPQGSKSTYVVDLDWTVKGSFQERVNSAFEFLFNGGISDFIKATYALYGRKTPASIYDGRKLQRESETSYQTKI